MDMRRKRQLLEQYKNRRPEMGILSFRCKTTDELFLCLSQDTKADINSTRFKLLGNTHPNKRMQALWNEYGESDFEITLMKAFKYDSPQDDHRDKLERLLAKCLEANPGAKRVWK